MVEPYPSEGLVMALSVATRISLCLPHDVALSTFIICSYLCALFVVYSTCLWCVLRVCGMCVLCL